MPVGIVTGASSGIGLAVTEHLLTRGFRVVMADVNAVEGERISARLGERTMFLKTDVAIYAEQAALFREAFRWGGNRLDFLAANAGIDDRQSLYEVNPAENEDGTPKELNLKTIHIDLEAVIQGIWLFKHYARKNEIPGGKIMITSSIAGLYPMSINPQYTAAKHALVGLTRASGMGSPFSLENITVNCICPTFVPTNICPPHIRDKFPPEHITPMSTVLKAVDTFLDNTSMSGEVIELSLDQLHHRQIPPFLDENTRWLCQEAGKIWEEG